MSNPNPHDAWWLLIVPAVLALILYGMWPTEPERQHWDEITADLQ